MVLVDLSKVQYANVVLQSNSDIQHVFLVAHRQSTGNHFCRWGMSTWLLFISQNSAYCTFAQSHLFHMYYILHTSCTYKDSYCVWYAYLYSNSFDYILFKLWFYSLLPISALLCYLLIEGGSINNILSYLMRVCCSSMSKGIILHMLNDNV